MTIDPELRDMIVQTHTLVARMDEENKEHKRNINGRLRGIDSKIESNHVFTVKKFDKHDVRLSSSEHFRTKVLAYISVASVFIGLAIEFAFGGIKKLFGV